MAFYLSDAVKNTMLASITTAAGAAATVKVWSGAVPTNANTAIGAQVMLVSLPLSNPIAGAPSAGVLTLTGVAPANVTTGGVAAFYRLMASDGTTCLAQGSVGATGENLNLITTTLTAGGPLDIDANGAFTITI